MKKDEGSESRYKNAFQNILNKNPNSTFCRMIKEYMVSQLQTTFEGENLEGHEEGSRKQESHAKFNLNFKKNKPRKIQLFDEEDSDREGVEEVESPQKQLIRKKKGGTGFMRPTNSPMRIRARSTKKGTYISPNKRRSSLNFKSNITPFEEPEEDQVDA